MQRLQVMKCGGCGTKTATLKARRAEHGVGFIELRLACTGCDVVTVLRPSAPSFKTDNHEDIGDGDFCVGWHNEESEP